MDNNPVFYFLNLGKKSNFEFHSAYLSNNNLFSRLQAVNFSKYPITYNHSVNIQFLLTWRFSKNFRRLLLRAINLPQFDFLLSISAFFRFYQDCSALMISRLAPDSDFIDRSKTSHADIIVIQ